LKSLTLCGRPDFLDCERVSRHTLHNETREEAEFLKRTASGSLFLIGSSVDGGSDREASDEEGFGNEGILTTRQRVPVDARSDIRVRLEGTYKSEHLMFPSHKEVRCPSTIRVQWSWASVDGLVSHSFSERNSINTVDLLEINIVGDIGHVTAGYVQLRGTLMPGLLTDAITDGSSHACIFIEHQQSSNQPVSNSDTKMHRIEKDVTIDDMIELSATAKEIFILPVQIRPLAESKVYDLLLLRKLDQGKFRRIGLAIIREAELTSKRGEFECVYKDFKRLWRKTPRTEFTIV
jgi:hypothetical protein